MYAILVQVLKIVCLVPRLFSITKANVVFYVRMDSMEIPPAVPVKNVSPFAQNARNFKNANPAKVLITFTDLHKVVLLSVPLVL